jgi:hypothetical protein
MMTRGPWLSYQDAAAYVQCPTMTAFYAWRRRHQIIPNRNGQIAKMDLDRVLNEPRPPRRMAKASLDNLLHRRA